MIIQERHDIWQKEYFVATLEKNWKTTVHDMCKWKSTVTETICLNKLWSMYHC